MTHEQATNGQAAERYLLGELSREERDQFEEHYFSCPECGKDVLEGMVFLDNAKVALAQEPQQQPFRKAEPQAAESGWRRWWSLATLAPTAAAGVFAITTGYYALVKVPGLQNEIRALTAPQVLASLVLPPATRGDGPVLEVPDGTRFVQITQDINMDERPSELEAEIQDSRGASVAVFRIPGSNGLSVMVPAERLPSGQYTLVLKRPASNQSSVAQEIERSRFTVHHK